MNLLQVLVSLTYLSSLVILTVLGYLSFKQRGNSTTNSLFYMVVAGFCFIGSSFLVIVFSSRSIMQAGLFLLAPSHWLLGLTIALFTLHFTGYYHRVSKRIVYSIYAIYGSLILISLTNPFHQLIINGYGISTDPFPYVYATPSLGLPIFLGVGYILNFTIAVAFLFAMVNSSRISHRQFFILSLIAGGTSFIHFAEYIFYKPTFAAGPFGFSAIFIISGFAYLVLSEDLLTLDPITRGDVISSLSQPVIITDSSGAIIDFNTAAATLFPPLTGSIGNKIENVKPELVDSVDKDSNTRTFTKEFSGTGPDGKFREYQVSAQQVAKGDKSHGTTLVLSDVTELKMYAQDLEQQTNQLEDFTSFVSHDLRNPIATSQQYLQMVEGKNETQAEYLDTVDRSLNRMNTMIENLLTLTREGQAIENRDTVSLSDTVEYAWEISDTKDATLKQEQLELTTAYADKDRLYTLFENLFRNASDHGGDDVTVTVGALPEEDAFYIADDGPGIKDGVNVFEKGVTTSRDGTGLGLAIVERIIDAHGWEIHAGTYDPTGGAKFTITGIRSLQMRPQETNSELKQNAEP